MQDQLNTEPGGRDSDDDYSGSDGGSSDSNAYYSDHDDRSEITGTTFSGMPSTFNSTGASNGGVRLDDAAGTIYGGSTTASRASSMAPSAAPSVDGLSLPSGFDPYRYRKGSAYASSVAGSVGSTTTVKSDRWAKPKNVSSIVPYL